MRAVRPSILIPLLVILSGAACAAAATSPEIARPAGSTTPQAIGMLHSLRNIPEACVLVEGLFTGDSGEPYRIEVLPHDPCARRAQFIDASRIQPSPSQHTHWLLNDRIEVPRADHPACVATVEIWRKPGTAAPPSLDAQGRARLYLDKPQARVDVPTYTAMLTWSAACKTVPKLSPPTPTASSPAAGS